MQIHKRNPPEWKKSLSQHHWDEQSLLMYVSLAAYRGWEQSFVLQRLWRRSVLVSALCSHFNFLAAMRTITMHHRTPSPAKQSWKPLGSFYISTQSPSPSRLRVTMQRMHPLSPPPQYQTPPQNGSSSIRTIPIDVLTAIFEYLPEPEFVSGTRSVNRSAILGVSRQWQQVGSKVLRKTLTFANASQTSVESWVDYADGVRGGEKELPLVTSLYLETFMDDLSGSVLRRVRGVRNLTVHTAAIGFRCFKLSKTVTPMDREIALSGMSLHYTVFLLRDLRRLFTPNSVVRCFSIVMLEIYEDHPNSWSSWSYWQEPPPLEIIRIKNLSTCVFDDVLHVSDLLTWILVPTLREIVIDMEVFRFGRRSGDRGLLLNRWPNALENLIVECNRRDIDLRSLQTLPIKALSIVKPPSLHSYGQNFADVLVALIKHREAFPNLKKLVVPEEGESSYHDLKRECGYRGIELSVEINRTFPFFSSNYKLKICRTNYNVW